MRAAAAAVGGALAAGRRELTEVEAYAVAGALGLAVPPHVVMPPGGPVPALDDLRSSRVVVKVLSPGLAHKTERGGVQVVDRDPGSVAGAVEEMAGAFAGEPVVGWLVTEFVAHDDRPGGELLVGVRRTAEFGPVVVIGLGGIHAEVLAASLPPVILPVGAGRAEWERALRDSPTVAALTGGLRGAPPAVEAGGLHTLVAGVLAGAGGLPPELAEFEANPVVLSGGRPTALDALARLGSLPAPAPPRPPAQVERLLHPRSLAVVGVSRRRNPGRVILENVLAAGFPPGAVTVIKPGESEVAGCRCVPDLGSLPGRVDLLVLSIGAEAAPAVLEEVVARSSAEAVILIPGGLGERAGSEALAAQVRAVLAEGRRRGGGPVVNGGNSMGIRSVPGRYDATFIPGYKLSPAPDAPVAPLAVISQSGAFAIARLDRFPCLRPRYLVTLGNQLDVTAGDYLTLLQDDPAVEVFACYLEGFCPGDGSRSLEAARRISARGGTVILYLGGRTPAGAAAASSHTASLAPDHRIARSLAAEAGVLVAESLEEFEDLLRVTVLLRGRRAAGRRLGAVSNAGFECVALADGAGPFSFPPLGAPTAVRVSSVLRRLGLEGVVGVRNPLDLTPMADGPGFVEAAAAVLGDPGVDLGVIGCVPLTPALPTLAAGPGHPEDLAAPGGPAELLARLWRETTKPWVLVIDGGSLYDALALHLESEGVPVFRTADRALRALGRLATRWLAY